MNCKKQGRYLPIWRAIIKHVVTADHMQWLPIAEIKAALNTTDVASVLHYLLAVVDALEIPLDQRPKCLETVGNA